MRTHPSATPRCGATAPLAGEPRTRGSGTKIPNRRAGGVTPSGKRRLAILLVAVLMLALAFPVLAETSGEPEADGGKLGFSAEELPDFGESGYTAPVPNSDGTSEEDATEPQDDLNRPDAPERTEETDPPQAEPEPSEAQERPAESTVTQPVQTSATEPEGQPVREEESAEGPGSASAPEATQPGRTVPVTAATGGIGLTVLAALAAALIISALAVTLRRIGKK